MSEETSCVLALFGLEWFSGYAGTAASGGNHGHQGRKEWHL